jgi:hypothetical protein
VMIFFPRFFLGLFLVPFLRPLPLCLTASAVPCCFLPPALRFLRSINHPKMWISSASHSGCPFRPPPRTRDRPDATEADAGGIPPPPPLPPPPPPSPPDRAQAQAHAAAASRSVGSGQSCRVCSGLARIVNWGWKQYVGRRGTRTRPGVMAITSSRQATARSRSGSRSHACGWRW